MVISFWLPFTVAVLIVRKVVNFRGSLWVTAWFEIVVSFDLTPVLVINLPQADVIVLGTSFEASALNCKSFFLGGGSGNLDNFQDDPSNLLAAVQMAVAGLKSRVPRLLS